MHRASSLRRGAHLFRISSSAELGQRLQRDGAVGVADQDLEARPLRVAGIEQAVVVGIKDARHPIKSKPWWWLTPV